jgi:uracil-DNA glycosylase family 4
MSDISQKIIACHKCPRLVAWREQMAFVKRKAYLGEEYWGKPVPGFGDPHARMMIVGLAPGAHGSNRTGRMFTGDASGVFLYRALHKAGFASHPESITIDDGLVLKDVFITAVCRCVPPGNKPSPQEISACIPYLKNEYQILSPIKLIVALGRIAFDTIIATLAEPNVKQKAIFSHGATIALGENKPLLLGSYHPSRQNTQTGRLTIEMFDSIWITASNYVAME